jgi:hypothetical protein
MPLIVLVVADAGQRYCQREASLAPALFSGPSQAVSATSSWLGSGGVKLVNGSIEPGGLVGTYFHRPFRSPCW